MVLAAYCYVLASTLPGWANEGVLPYQLEIYLNGQPKNLIMGFADEGEGAFAARPADLAALGIALPDEAKSRKLVRLSEIGTFRYDGATQKMYLDIPPERFQPSVVDARDHAVRTEPARAGHGAVLSYALAGSALQYDDSERGSSAIDTSLTATFDGRVFSPSGLFQFGAIAGTTLADSSPMVRLDTVWQQFNEADLTVMRVGDAISGPLSWTRPIRFGGVQYQRNFGLRPDLVTNPLPVVTGTAAVPSTVDIFVDNVRTYSRDVAAGPFSISNVPVVGNGGQARVVIRDASGRITESTTSFYTAPLLLRQGLLDFSLEAGFPRRNFGTYSFDYESDIAASGSARYGWSDNFTLEGHMEVGLGVLNAGAGVIFPVGLTTLVNVAMSGSHTDEGSGVRLYSGFETKWGDITLAGSLEGSFGHYSDLAAATSIASQQEDWSRILAAQVSKAQAIVSLSAPVPVVEGHATVSLIEAIAYDDEERRIVAASYGRRVTDKVFGFATGSWDLTRNDGSVFVGFNVLLQDRQTASIGATATPNSRGLTAEYTGYRQDGPNHFGWRTSTTRGSNARDVAGMTYQGSLVRADAYAARTRSSTFLTAYVTGAIATIDGEVYVASQLDDGFAVVDIGHPGVEVQFDNRPIGKTDSRGRVFVPGLLGHNLNQITFDPTVLPADVQPSEIKKHVVPMRGSGVVVDMKVKPAGSSALVEFVTADGTHVPVGSPVRIAGVDGEAIVGFDGQAYFETLAPRNEATIDLETGPCKAVFPFAPQPGKQVFVEKVVCR